jgi:hypothetical protein
MRKEPKDPDEVQPWRRLDGSCLFNNYDLVSKGRGGQRYCHAGPGGDQH